MDRCTCVGRSSTRSNRRGLRCTRISAQIFTDGKTSAYKQHRRPRSRSMNECVGGGRAVVGTSESARGGFTWANRIEGDADVCQAAQGEGFEAYRLSLVVRCDTNCSNEGRIWSRKQAAARCIVDRPPRCNSSWLSISVQYLNWWISTPHPLG